ncbi:MAG: trimethylamine methyltransferase family protein [Candidatus Bathyarchaeia archaeon]
MSFTFKPRLNIGDIVPKRLIETMHERALEVLEKVGIKVTNKLLIRRIIERNGFKLDREWVKIKSSLVEDLVVEVRRKRKHSMMRSLSEEELILSPGYPGCSWIVDLETDTIKPLTTEKLVEATKLTDSLYEWGVRGGAPGAPVDVPPKLRRVAQCLIGYTYSRSAGPAPFESYEEAVYIKRMADVMGHGFGVDVYVISPLRLEGISLDRAIPFLENGECDWVGITSMPLAGATAPVYPVGAFIQGISEALGGYAILHEAYPDIPMGFSVNAYHFDMRHGNIVFGSPEQTLMDLFSIVLNMFYGGGLHGVRSFRTVAKQVDIQAQVEKASSATVGVLTGPGAFIHAGLLSIDEIFSPVQLIIDCELAKYLTRLAKGLEFTEDQIELSIETIARCALKGQYLTDETTLKDYRRIYWTPEIFDYSLLHTYKPGPDIIAKAKKICKEKIQTHRYQLEDERRKKLEEIYREAVKTLS